jgi:hypothetical protein
MRARGSSSSVRHLAACFLLCAAFEPAVGAPLYQITDFGFNAVAMNDRGID